MSSYPSFEAQEEVDLGELGSLRSITAIAVLLLLSVVELRSVPFTVEGLKGVYDNLAVEGLSRVFAKD
ncbi:hypothetical protein DQ04_02101020 [Trypanosoma grayi]|uniref:hypothetical protein n=1 Tax=Trypanosoma grayi TaxID=71804 RepID=UPI0004F40185|nr:hypothetical protein DQ04_02101020 [Trypanosoma grayi]KEG11968.1 hypothetical protein DQ04_02101020 [Trypanosoma grayi]